jgi:hypothetical protein
MASGVLSGGERRSCPVWLPFARGRASFATAQNPFMCCMHLACAWRCRCMHINTAAKADPLQTTVCSGWPCAACVPCRIFGERCGLTVCPSMCALTACVCAGRSILAQAGVPQQPWPVPAAPSSSCSGCNKLCCNVHGQLLRVTRLRGWREPGTAPAVSSGSWGMSSCGGACPTPAFLSLIMRLAESLLVLLAPPGRIEFFNLLRGSTAWRRAAVRSHSGTAPPAAPRGLWAAGAGLVGRTAVWLLAGSPAGASVALGFIIRTKRPCVTIGQLRHLLLPLVRLRRLHYSTGAPCSPLDRSQVRRSLAVSDHRQDQPAGLALLGRGWCSWCHAEARRNQATGMHTITRFANPPNLPPTGHELGLGVGPP